VSVVNGYLHGDSTRVRHGVRRRAIHDTGWASGHLGDRARYNRRVSAGL